MRPLERADIVALLTGVPRRPTARIIDKGSDFEHHCPYPKSTTLTWVDRNTDKPHRCPCCHAVSTYDKWRFGPRTRIVCRRGCGVQWRHGGRYVPRTRRHFERTISR